MTESSSTVELNEKIGPYQHKTLWASIVGYAMDGLDMMMLAFVLPLIIAYYSINPAQAGSISTITMLGVVIGGYIFGILADSYGRVRVFTWTILIFSVFTGLCAFAPNFETFNIFRFLSGLGLGGEFGIGMTLVTETWPKKLRTRATSYVALGYQAGTILATLTAAFIAPHFGWKGVFLVGVIPALLAWWSRRSLKEPDIWLKTKNEKKTSISIVELFKGWRVTGTTIGLILICSVQNFGYFGIMNWMPTMLATQHHYTINGTVVWTISTVIGMVLGIITFAWLADKWGRKPAYITFQICAAIIVWIYFQIDSPTLLVALGSVLGFFVNGMMGGYGALLAEHYATRARSTAENIIFNTGRFIGSFGPLIIGFMALNHSLSAALGTISCVYIIAALSMFFLVPETKGKDLA
ncbi:MFS transporter [Sporolactobacillus nakayamae]|uniref:Predicted arabinose efflux permease, MFS family n=1 Tax=Sporolactobacillus nakayamae TaxID=269670 RepID=A0A1I2SBJ2_9BACL|nr:MFS transporter [Sporolactobacillus nakayamae]SFG49733.1 Predicted arabinose efflux permease, MFS family [Sporolactobacillus nakayamae]